MARFTARNLADFRSASTMQDHYEAGLRDIPCSPSAGMRQKGGRPAVSPDWFTNERVQLGDPEKPYPIRR